MEASLTLAFDAVAKTGRLTDATNYAALGINLATFNAKGLGTIYFNGEVAYQKLTVGSPLINLASGATYYDFDLITDSNGVISNGTYKIVYSNRFAVLQPSQVDIMTITDPSTMVTDGSAVLANVLEEGNELTLDDASTVTVVSVTAASANCVIVIEETTLTSQGAFNFDVTNETFNETFTYSGCTMLTPEITVSYDCDNGDNGTFTAQDSTDFSTQTLVEREMIITPPAWATQIEAVTTEDQSYTVNRLATGTWTVSITDEITYTQADGLILNYTITKVQEEVVTCAGTLCGLNACIESLRAAHDAELTANGISKYQKYVDNVALYYIKAKNYKECGDYADYQSQVALIQAQLDAAPCECECCDDDELKYIYNTSSATQAQIAVMQAEILALQETTYSQVLFTSPFMFATTQGNTDYPVTQTYVRPFADLSEITIDKKYFEAEPNGYAKKYVEIEIEAYIGGSADSFTQVSVADGDPLFTSDAVTGDEVTTRYMVRLTTFSASGASFCLVTSSSFQISNADSTDILDNYFDANTMGDLWNLEQDLVLDLTPSTNNPDKIVYTYVKITAIGYE